MSKKYQAVGFMSGTSLDAIDIAWIETDGQDEVSFVAADTYPYDPHFREQLRQCLGKREGRADPVVARLEKEMTLRHAQAFEAFLKTMERAPHDIDIIGFHGQTIWHDPRKKETIQIGDGALLAEMTGVSVVNDFRSADVKAGGQGAPLVPLYHRALAAKLDKPVAIINIGGVSNITWVGGKDDFDLLAFDLGPGNALLDDWVNGKAGLSYDKDGVLASKGKVNDAHMELFLHHPFFEKVPPKSLDRDAFSNFVPSGLSLEDGAATLTMMTVQAIVEGLKVVPSKPQALYLTGGGRLNRTLCEWLAQQSGLPVCSVDELGWRGDSLEAEAFAYLAVRSLMGEVITLPSTTAAPTPMTGGVLHRAKA